MAAATLEALGMIEMQRVRRPGRGQRRDVEGGERRAGRLGQDRQRPGHGVRGGRRRGRQGGGRRGAAAASRIGEVVSVQVIPRPHEDLGGILTFTKAAVRPPAAPKAPKNDGA